MFNFKDKKDRKRLIIMTLTLTLLIFLIIIENKYAIPSNPCIMYNDKMYLVTFEKFEKVEELKKEGSIVNYTEKFSLDENYKGYFVPIKSEIYKVESSNEDMSDILVIKFSENVIYKGEYYKGKYYIARQILKLIKHSYWIYSI